MKKTLVFITLIMCIFGICSTTAHATNDSILFETYSKDIESYTLLNEDFDASKVYSNLNSIKSKISEISNAEHQYLYFKEMINSLGYKQFVLISNLYANSYFIFDTLEEKIIEASLETSNPYNIDLDYIIPVYAGVGKYFYIYNSELFNCDDEVINDYNMSKLEQIESNYINRFSSMLVDDCCNHENNRAMNTTDYEISNSFFFKHSNLPTQYNTSGSCGYVALALLLSYYDTFFNNSIIPDTLYHTAIGTFNTWDKAESSNNNYKKNIANWSNGPVITKNFHDYLIRLDGKVPGSGNDYIDEITICTTVQNYLNAVSISSSDLSFSSQANNFSSSTVLSILNSNKPLILGAYGYSYNNSTINDTFISVPNGNHAMVAYGYIQTSSDLYYKVHMGYTGYSNALLIISNSINGCCQFSCSLSHTHSTNYIFDHGLSSHGMCPCQSSSTYYTYSYSTNGDKIKCQICNTIFYDSCDLTYIVSGNLTHNISCMNCNHSYSSENHNFTITTTSTLHDMTCTLCGYHEYGSHSFYYEQFNSIKHTKICSRCNYSIKETHTFQQTLVNGQYIMMCTKCGEVSLLS